MTIDLKKIKKARQEEAKKDPIELDLASRIAFLLSQGQRVETFNGEPNFFIKHKKSKLKTPPFYLTEAKEFDLAEHIIQEHDCPYLNFITNLGEAAYAKALFELDQNIEPNILKEEDMRTIFAALICSFTRLRSIVLPQNKSLINKQITPANH